MSIYSTKQCCYIAMSAAVSDKSDVVRTIIDKIKLEKG